MDLQLLKELNAARAKRQAVIMVTPVDGGAQRLVHEGGIGNDDPIAADLAKHFRSTKSAMIESPSGDLFLTVHVPPPRLVIIGAVHISQAMAPMARIAGFDLTIIDPRTAFATDSRFTDTDLLAEWPEDIWAQLAVDRFTALAALTHDPKIDDFPLKHGLLQGCFYVGALGSRKTHAKRIERLTQAGVSEADLARIHAPIGLDLGAQSPAEIAVAVLAQIIEAWRRRPVEALAEPVAGEAA